VPRWRDQGRRRSATLRRLQQAPPQQTASLMQRSPSNAQPTPPQQTDELH
jgi:hypothetical protein